MSEIGVEDCGDNSCLFVFAEHRGGMRTNGGCRCFRDDVPHAVWRRLVHWVQRTRTRHQLAIAKLETACAEAMRKADDHRRQRDEANRAYETTAKAYNTLNEAFAQALEEGRREAREELRPHSDELWEAHAQGDEARISSAIYDLRQEFRKG